MSITQPTDAELRELFGIDEPRKARCPYFPDPIHLSDSHIDALLVQHLGNPSDPGRRQWLAKEIRKAAEHFMNDVALQSSPTSAASLKQLKRIQSAARSLRTALGWDGESFETIPWRPVHTWLRQAAEQYQSRVKLPQGVSRYDVPWNYWESWKLPASIGGIKLLELWAQEACAIVTRTLNAKRPKHVLCVAVHRLCLCWLNAYGTAPGRGIRIVPARAIKDKDRYEATGPFMRFALAFFGYMSQSASAKQMTDYPELRKLLRPSRDTIRLYVKWFKARLKGKAGRAK